MKKLLLILAAILLLVACGEDEPQETEPIIDVQEEVVEETESAEEVEEEVEEEPEVVEEENTIDTSMYEYATNIEVTDAIDVNEHITLMIDMSEETQPGMAFQHVLNQTYDFVKQEGIEGAKTIGVNIRQGGNKIAMFTVNTDEFVEDDETPLAQLVLDASLVEMTTPEVDEYADVMGLELNR